MLTDGSCWIADHVSPRMDGEWLALWPIDGHLGGSQFGGITNKAAVNICTQIFVWTRINKSFPVG